MPSVNLSDVCRENARRFPQGVAAIDGDIRYSWPEFDRRIDQVARMLADQGVVAGDRVLWIAQTSVRFLELMLACARLGVMICPVNWRQSGEELAFVIADFDPAVIVWQEEEIGAAVAEARRLSSDYAGSWIRHDTDEAGGYLDLVADSDGAPVEVPVDADSALLVIYTAATAGRPAGSLLSQRNLIAMATMTAAITGVDHGDVFINSGPLFHIGNFQFDSLPVFVRGGTNVYVRRVEEEQLLRLVAQERVTSAFLMPPTILKMKELNAELKLDISSLRAGPFAPLWGDALAPDTSTWARHTGGFGQTELTGLCILNGYGGKGTGNSGRPTPLCQVRIVDPEGNEVPVGEAGEITVRGDTVHLGYWNRPDRNAERMRDGWWHTTDLGRLEADGTLEFLGTMTRMIKSAAENVYPAEVERCLSTHPAVSGAAVIGVPDPKYAQSVKAVVVLNEGAEASAQELIEHCRARIASYKKPKFVEFVDQLPLVGGRPDYDALDARFGGGGYPGGRNVAT
ncbi:acyl-CoA synthetase [Mycobacterium sp. Root265]|uniref:AMP-binding protein n=1 Tax=Mycobacterium sp. Root265 TaxID=1736504 RepID=UPI00070EC599|nr:AMP-binding protein [Mycobacterium sp. Root265]KRD05736.1 acyl-CoA synthetase [Mycobacterium sp. Root265]